MTTPEIMAELEAMAQPSIRQIFLNHGAPESTHLGVKVEDMKKIQKKVKKDYRLSKELYQTGISDAMYLAGLIADERKMTPDDLRQWANGATWHMISEFTVPWIAAESGHGLELGLEWIESAEEKVASAGWATLGCAVALVPDEKLDLELMRSLLQQVELAIHQAPNRVRYTMNNFVIAVGTYVAPLHNAALEAAEAIGKVQVFMGKTACKVPAAPDYIRKVAAMGKVGKKRKMVRC